MSEPKPETTGWIVGNNGYRRRGRVIATVGKAQREPWYETEDGTKWSSFDVLFNPDPMSEPKTTVCPVCQGTSPEGIECPRCRLALGKEDRVSEPNERPEDFDEWLNAGADAFGGETAYMRYIRRLEADNAWRRTTLTNRDKTVSRMSKEIASVKTERDEARINLRALEASAATKPADGPFRTGGQVTLNVYEGDRPIFQAHTPEDAERLVSLLNAGASAPKPMIVGDGEHTPGPWTCRSGVDLEVKTKRGVEMLQTPAHVVKVDQDGEGRKRTMFICDCAGVGLPNEANARLIAAAPETAAELERAKKELIRWRALGAETPEGLRAVIEYAGQVKKTITDPELARLRETNRDQATILADLREWMSVAGMAVEKDVDMLFVLKGRFDALAASKRDLVEAVKEQQIRLTDMFRRWELPTYRDPASAGSDLTLILAAGRLAIDRAKVSE